MTLAVRRHADVATFARRAESWLLEREVEHTVALGVLEQLRAGAAAYRPPFYLATVEDGDRVVGCAFRTPPHGLGVTDLPRAAAPLVAADVASIFAALPAINGPSAAAAAVATAWTALRGVQVEDVQRQRVHELTAVVDLANPAPGALHPAGPDDLPLVFDWFEAFELEAEVFQGRDEARARAAERLEAGALFLWRDGTEVGCLLGVAARSPNGARVGPVYTPPELRGRGYATAAVARLSADLLASGRRFCCLFTDVANPTSNAIYARVGYRPVAEASAVRFRSRSWA